MVASTVTPPRYPPPVDAGLYESLLTERLNAVLAQRPDLQPHLSTVDDAEQELTIARHLTPLIERQLRAAGNAEARARLLRNILDALGDPEALTETVHQDDPGKIRRLDAITPKTLGTPQLPRPATPFGLTATPERGDGIDVRAFFGGRVAAELRLWDALEQNLLCPFHYFGIHDGIDLETLQWKRGG